MASLNSWPIPFQPNTPSVIIAPPNKPAKSFTEQVKDNALVIKEYQAEKGEE